MSALNAAGLDRLLTNGLDAVDKLTLHSADPGAAGTDNVVSDAPVACTWDTAQSDGDTGRQRPLAAAVEFSGASPTTTVDCIGLWDDTVYLGCITRSTGDAATNAAGTYTVTTDTAISLDMAA